jgi:hypothetical protein
MKFAAHICFLSLLLHASYLQANCSGNQVIDHRKPAFYDEQNNRHLMRNQGESGWCYAYAASDLVTFHLAKNNPAALQSQNGRAVPREAQLISPVSALSSYRAQKGKGTFSETLDGGFIDDFMSQFSNPKKRICLENEVNSSNVSGASERTSLSVSIAMNNLEDLYNKLNLQNDSSHDQAHLCSAWNDGFSQVFPGLDFDDFQKIFGDIKSEGGSSFDMINAMIENSCKNPVQIGRLPEVKQMKKRDNPTAFLQEINRQLEQGNIVGVKYNLDFLEKNDADENAEGSQHWSSIVGRRCVNGKSQFLIRNSFGTDCETYLDKNNCEEGNVWVPEETLFKMSNRINYL